MRKRNTIIIGGIVLLAFVSIGGFIYVKSVMPPGEEWISYENERLITSIDEQLKDVDIDSVIAKKEKYVLEKGVDELQQAVTRGEITYEDITAIYLYRIKTLDQSEHGYNSVVEIAPDAIEQARERDAQRIDMTAVEGSKRASKLFGIPVMLKDNINTADMATSSGTVAFSEFIPQEDAKLVRALREQGAIILGKNNLSEFANYVSRIMPSGYSGKKGQTVNPFKPLKISPSGSSSGSAVTVTANLAPISIGTETAGSIVAPAAINSVVGFKPSRNSVSSEGIMPLIKTVDTAGPIGKNVRDVAIAYDVMSEGFTLSTLEGTALNGATIGLLYYDYNDEDMIEKLKKELKRLGSNVIEVQINQDGIQVQNIIDQTFKKDFEDFAVQYNLPIKRLEDLIEYNKADSKRRIRYGQDLLEAANAVEVPNPTEIETSIQNAQLALNAVFEEYKLDALVFLNSTDSTIVSAAGFPELTIPFGVDGKGVPQGSTFVTREGEDDKLLSIGYSFEEMVRGRVGV